MQHSATLCHHIWQRPALDAQNSPGSCELLLNHWKQDLMRNFNFFLFLLLNVFHLAVHHSLCRYSPDHKFRNSGTWSFRVHLKQNTVSCTLRCSMEIQLPKYLDQWIGLAVSRLLSNLFAGLLFPFLRANRDATCRALESDPSVARPNVPVLT